MPLRMGLKNTDKVFIVGRGSAGTLGIALLPGQVDTVTPADTTVIITPDNPPLPTDADYNFADGTLVPKGTVTQFSGTVSFSPAAVPNAAVQVTQSIKNADGSPVLDQNGVAIPDLIDTVTLVPELLAAEGELFGVPV
jgi:hypothetical protein